MTINQVAIFVIVVVASAITICWAVFHAAAEIEESMDELSDEIEMKFTSEKQTVPGVAWNQGGRMKVEIDKVKLAFDTTLLVFSFVQFIIACYLVGKYIKP